MFVNSGQFLWRWRGLPAPSGPPGTEHSWFQWRARMGERCHPSRGTCHPAGFERCMWGSSLCRHCSSCSAQLHGVAGRYGRWGPESSSTLHKVTQQAGEHIWTTVWLKTFSETQQVLWRMFIFVFPLSPSFRQSPRRRNIWVLLFPWHIHLWPHRSFWGLPGATEAAAATVVAPGADSISAMESPFPR